MKDNKPELDNLQRIQEQMAERHMDSATTQYMEEMAKACFQLGAVEAHQKGNINLADYLPQDMPELIKKVIGTRMHKRVENLVVVLDTEAVPPHICEQVHAMLAAASVAVHDLLENFVGATPDLTVGGHKPENN